MRDERPALVASRLDPQTISLHETAPASIVCPGCGRWRRVKRAQIFPHDITAGIATPFPGEKAGTCPGSRLRVVVDLTLVEWQARLREAARIAGQRRSTRIQPKPHASIAEPVVRLAQRPLLVKRREANRNADRGHAERARPVPRTARPA